MIMVLVEHFFTEGGRERFPAWVRAIGAAASRYSGFADIRQMTLRDEPQRCFFLLAFETPAQLQAWIASPDRQQLLDQMDAYRLKPQLGTTWIAGEPWSAARAAAD